MGWGETARDSISEARKKLGSKHRHPSSPSRPHLNSRLLASRPCTLSTETFSCPIEINICLDFMARTKAILPEEFYQLQNEEESGEPERVVSDAPPPYSSISAESAAYFDYKDESGFPKPPSYNVATTLPTYDEAERTKAEATIPLVPGRDDDFVARDDFDDADQLRIGNDGIFMLTFFMAFLFNWIGFFLSFCLTTSAAGRYGAISGFGLSLIKWILIVRFSTYFPGYFDGQYWLWWVFLILGFLLFLRGFINYAKVRKMPDTFSTLPRTRVLFIY
uniref:Nedd4 family interacting protein 1 n=1 Tax=Vombatus ursinus TaxID=29139 RepID=A0A4X2KIZ9_VOMUR